MPSLELKNGVLRWRGRVMVSGVKRSKWFPNDGRASKRAAVLWEVEERERMTAETGRTGKTPTVSCPTLLEAANAYLSDVRARQSRRTYEEKKTSFRRLFEEITPEIMPSGLNLLDAMNYLQLQAEKRSPHAANKDRKNLAAMWEWCRRVLGFQGFPRDLINPWRESRTFPVDKQGRYVPPEEDVQTVLEYARQEAETGGPAAIQDYAMLRFYRDTGARKREAFILDIGRDLDMTKRVLWLTSRKTRDGSAKRIAAPMTEALTEALARWLEVRPKVESSAVFICVDQTAFTVEHYGAPFRARNHWMNRLCARAGVKPFGLHGIRHRFAVGLYESGAAVATVQRLLRHQNAQTTETYLRALGLDMDGAREAVERSTRAAGAADLAGRGKVIPLPMRATA